MELDEITGAILDASPRIPREIGPGMLESLYVGMLARELRRGGVRAERERLISFSYDGMAVEDAFRADLLVEEHVIVEVTSVERLALVHRKQLLTHLRLTNLRVGFLLDFGAETMKDGVTRVFNNFARSSAPHLAVTRPRLWARPSLPRRGPQKLLRDVALRASASRSPRLRVKSPALWC